MLDIPGMDQMETLPLDIDDSTSLASTTVGPEWQEIFEREKAEETAEGVRVESGLGGDCGGAPNLALEVKEVEHSDEVEADTKSGDKTSASMAVELPHIEETSSAATPAEIAEDKSKDAAPTATPTNKSSAQESGKAGEQEKGKIGEKVDLMSSLTFSNGKTLEAVKAATWISQSESKHRVRKVKENRRKALEQEEPVAPPAKPESWGKVETVSPAEQCPPKTRGRKAKKTEHAEEKDVKKTTGRKRKNKNNKGSKSQKKQPDAPAKRAKVEANVSSDTRLTPSQRVGEYLSEKKRQRLAKEAEEAAARPAKSRKGGKAELGNAAIKDEGARKGKGPKKKDDGRKKARRF